MKILKIFGIVLVVCLVLAAGGCSAVLGVMNNRNENYWKYTETGGIIESRYTAPGTYEVSRTEWNADGKAWQKYEVWYQLRSILIILPYLLILCYNVFCTIISDGTKRQDIKFLT